MSGSDFDFSEHALERAPLRASDPQAPLLILLHGYGSNEADLFSFAHALPAAYRVISLRAPHRMDFGGFAWYPLEWGPTGLKSDLASASRTLSMLEHGISELERTRNAAPGQTVLLGFSQGAIVSLALALASGDRFRAVCGFSGYWDASLLPLAKGTHRPLVFIAHGRLDEVVPFQAHLNTKALFESLDIRFSAYESDYGHGIPPEAFATALEVL